MPAADVLGDPERLSALEDVLPAALAHRDSMDRLAALAAAIMDTPAAMVNLIDDRHQHLVGLVGLGEPYASERRMPLGVGDCPATLLRGEPCYREDVLDPGGAGRPSAPVGRAAYAGVPLRDEGGHLLGTLCVVDTRAHRWLPAQRRALETLGESVIGEMALHGGVDRRQRLLDAFDLAPAAIAVTGGSPHVLQYQNVACRVVFGDLELSAPVRRAFGDFPEQFFTMMERVMASGDAVSATDVALSMRWPGESEPRQRFFDVSYAATGTLPGLTGPTAGDEEDAARGLLIVAVEVTERVLAHRALGRRARHQELLARAGAALNRNLDPIDELRALANVVVPELADLSTVHLLARPVPPGVTPPLPVLSQRVAVTVAPGLTAPEMRSGVHWNSRDDPVPAAIRHGAMLPHPIHTPATPGWAEGNGSEAAFRDGLNHVVLAPLVVEGLVVAVVTFGMCGDRPLWTPDEQATLGEIAALAGIAVGHGLTYQHTRTSALILQRSLLSDPPHVAGLETYARYQPAGDDEVGGDWYDMFHRRPGQLALVIGDVVGHDITAAAAMGQLRATLRGLALDRDDGPAAILQRLTTINTRLDITRFTTLIHAHLTRQGSTHEPTAPWVLRWANAGHPPPLLLAPGSAPRLLRRPHGAALIQQPTPAQTDGQITLPPGSTLLLYTDGLVERHGTDLEDNLADFTDRAEATAHEPLGQLCTQLLRDAPTTDDVALLAIRVCG